MPDLSAIKRTCPNVIGHSGTLLPRIRGGQIVPGTQCARVYLSKKLPVDQLRPDELVPASVEGIETDCVVLGEITIASLLPMATVPPTLYTGRWEQLVSGISMGHGTITSGTLGCFVVGADGKDYILTNWHVAVGSQGKQGDIEYQPGPYDIQQVYGEAPSEKYAAGLLQAFLSPPLGQADAALVRPTRSYNRDMFVSPAAVGQARPLLLSGIKDAVVGMACLKEGRTSGLTRGHVTDTDAELDVSYGGIGALTFKHLVVVQGANGNYLSGGDSGSVTREDAGQPEKQAAVGLNFAGSLSGYGIAFPMSKVAQDLGFSFSGGAPMGYGASNEQTVTITINPPAGTVATLLKGFRTDKAVYAQTEAILIYGTLVEAVSGEPVVGADVQVAFGGPQPVHFTTDAQGNFSGSLSGLAPGTYTLRAQFMGSA